MRRWPRNPQLVSLQERLRRMVGYVREVAADPAEPAQGTTALPRMAPGRREQLLEKTWRGSEVRVENHAEAGTESETPAKTVIPVEFPAENAPLVRAGGNRWLALAACLVGLLLATTFLFEGVLPARNAAFSPSTGESAERDRWVNWPFSKAMPTEARFGQRTAEPRVLRPHPVWPQWTRRRRHRRLRSPKTSHNRWPSRREISPSCAPILAPALRRRTVLVRSSPWRVPAGALPGAIVRPA